jgi:hypothetical protein
MRMKRFNVSLTVKRCGGDPLDCWLGGMPLDAQALHPMFLVGDDLSGKRQARDEAEVCDGGEHRLSCTSQDLI